MPVSSVVVEIKEGAEETLLGEIARVPHATVFGVKNSQIVTVIEGEDTNAVQTIIHTLSTLEGVTGVYPVYTGEE